MPNFAIPGKPEYDGENRTNVKLNGQWHIPYDKKTKTPAPAASLAVKKNDSNASAPAAPIAQAQVVKQAVNQPVNNTNATAAQVDSRVQVRE